MCAGPRAAFARASRVAYGRFSPPATLSVIPGKSYATIQLLTYLYGFQVSRVVPGERPRHQALLSLGGILPRPGRLPPLSPILKTLSQTIPNHTLHLPPTHHTLAPLNDPRRARVARKAHALSRSFTRRHASNPSLQFTCGNAPTVFYASSAIPVSTPQPQISRFGYVAILIPFQRFVLYAHARQAPCTLDYT